jgi:branched-chain amino acid transport system substrate-binding protein
MAAFVGASIMLETIKAAGSTDMEKVKAAAAKLDKPVGTYATGFGVKFDQNFQNTRAFPVVAQWQDGKMITVYPVDATPEGAKLADMRRK